MNLTEEKNNPAGERHNTCVSRAYAKIVYFLLDFFVCYFCTGGINKVCPHRIRIDQSNMQYRDCYYRYTEVDGSVARNIQLGIVNLVTRIKPEALYSVWDFNVYVDRITQSAHSHFPLYFGTL